MLKTKTNEVLSKLDDVVNEGMKQAVTTDIFNMSIEDLNLLKSLMAVYKDCKDLTLEQADMTDSIYNKLNEVLDGQKKGEFERVELSMKLKTILKNQAAIMAKLNIE